MKKINLLKVNTDLSASTGNATICYADSDKLEQFSSDLNEKKQEIQESIDRMFKIIDEMGTNGAWSGSVYEQFKAKCHTFEGVLNGYAEIVGVFSEQIKVIKSDTDNLVTDILEASEG